MDIYYDPIYGKVTLDPVEESIVSSSSFQRLRHIRQMGLCYLIFPGSNHTRFEHSLGVAHLAGLLIDALSNGGVLDESETRRWRCLTRLACLCHDLGHGPYSHLSEELLESIGVNDGHEANSKGIVLHKLGDCFDDPNLKSLDITPQSVIDVMSGARGDGIIEMSTQLVASDLDLDRFDFLNRDSYYVGLSEFMPSVASLIRNAWNVVRVSGTPTLSLKVNTGIRLAEEVMLMRRRNYETIVYNDAHIAACAMFHKAFRIAKERSVRFREIAAAGVTIDFDYSNESSFSRFVATLPEFTTYTDYELYWSIAESNAVSKRILTDLAQGKLLTPVISKSLALMHFRTREAVQRISSNGLERAQWVELLETRLARTAGIDPANVAVYVPKYRGFREVNVQLENGRSIRDVSPIASLIEAEYSRMFHVWCFVRQDVYADAYDAINSDLNAIFDEGATI